MNINTHGSFSMWWPCLISWQPCDWYCQYPWHKPLLPICQTTAVQHQIAGNTHVLIYKYYSAQWMLKAFLEQQTKNEEENAPLGLAVLVCWYFSRNQWMIISLAKKITDNYFLVPVFFWERCWEQWDMIPCQERAAATCRRRRTTIIQNLGQRSSLSLSLSAPPCQLWQASLITALHTFNPVPVLNCWSYWREMDIWRAAKASSALHEWEKWNTSYDNKNPN